MPTHKILQIPFVREALGMAGGALVALVIYGVYQQASGLVTAHLLPQEKSIVTDEVVKMRTENIQRITLRTREILGQRDNARVH
jgi:hypothetical protein